MGIRQMKGRRDLNKIIFNDSMTLTRLLLENSLTGYIGALCIFLLWC